MRFCCLGLSVLVLWSMPLRAISKLFRRHQFQKHKAQDVDLTDQSAPSYEAFTDTTVWWHYLQLTAACTRSVCRRSGFAARSLSIPNSALSLTGSCAMQGLKACLACQMMPLQQVLQAWTLAVGRRMVMYGSQWKSVTATLPQVSSNGGKGEPANPTAALTLLVAGTGSLELLTACD